MVKGLVLSWQNLVREIIPKNQKTHEFAIQKQSVNVCKKSQTGQSLGKLSIVLQCKHYMLMQTLYIAYRT